MKLTEPSILIRGPAGNLELISTRPNEKLSLNTTAIICHPHPLMGGAMNNKVVTTLARTFKELGCRTVRFNFRGVGNSDGSYDEGRGELDDLLAVSAWVQKEFPNEFIWLAGFSFGSFIAMRGTPYIAPQQLVMVAPAVTRFNFAIPQVNCPWIVVQGEQDEVVEPHAVYQWVEEQNPKPQLIRIPEASHFFHGKLVVLREALLKALT